MRNMKKFLSLLLAVLMVIAMLPLSSIAALATASDNTFDVKIIYESGSRRYGEITAYNGSDTSVTFPSQIGDVQIVGVSITKQPKEANALRSVTVSEGIIYIGANTFSGCRALQITLPESLRYIGTRAFNFSSIARINFPSGLEGIDMFAFDSVTFADTAVTLPDSLLYLGTYAFAESNITACHCGSRVKPALMEYAYPGSVIERYAAFTIPGTDGEVLPFACCEELRLLSADPENPYITVKDNALYTDGGRTLQVVAGDRDRFSIDDTVETLCPYAFHEGQHIGELYIGSGLQTLPEDAFAGMNIGSVQFSAACQLRKISNGAFSGATVAEPLVIPKSVQEIEESAFSTATLSDVSFEENSSLSVMHYHAFFNAVVNSVDFSNCRAMTLLGRGSFSYSTLRTVDLSNTLIGKLEGYTFEGCEELTSVILSDYTSELDSNCFKDCDSLEEVHYGYSITIPSDEQIPFKHDAAFVQWTTVGDFKFAEYEDYASLAKYQGEKEIDTLTIPDTVNGKPVKEIRKDVFNASLKQCRQVILPQQLEVIGPNAFFNSGITEIERFPDALKYIGSNAFASNPLTALQLNDGLLYIGGSAFRGSDIADFTVPDTAVRVGYYPVKQCQTLSFGAAVRNIEETLGLEEESGDAVRKTLAAITVSDSNPCYTSKDGVLYNKDMTELIYYPADKPDREFVVPESVQVIGEYAFREAQHLEKMTLTAVRRIGQDSFEGCRVLQTVVFKNDVSIQRLKSTFADLSTLTTVVFKDGAEVVQLSYTFCGTSLTDICLPSGVRAVNGAFADVRTLRSVTFSEGIETVGANAFRGTALTALSLPQSLRHISQDAFADCVDLQQLSLGGTQYIGKNAFAGCLSLTQVDLTGIRTEPDAFKDCINLKKLRFDDLQSQTPITEDAFEGNGSVETVVIGSSVSEIQSRAFADCTALETAYISDSVTAIAEDAFDGCEQLTIVCMAGSPAMHYAVSNNIPYQTFVIAPIPDQPYTGRAVTPALQVSQGGKRLTVDKEYRAIYSDNVQIGTATVTVVGLGDYSIFGTTAKFQIVASTVKNGWQQRGGQWYYYRGGSAVRYWQKISGKWYYFNTQGVMLTGWLKAKGKWYYLRDSGAMATGWVKVKGKWYYLNTDGAMQTGWLKLGGKWYYLNTDGAMRTASLKQGGKTYRFNSSGVCTNP